MRRQDLQEKLVELGFDVAGGTPEEFSTWLRKEIAKLSKVVKDAGVRLESL